MARNHTPDELVRSEIERLRKTDEVKLAEKEYRLQERERKYLADLRWKYKRGKKLMDEGWTLDTIELMFENIPEDSGQ